MPPALTTNFDFIYPFSVFTPDILLSLVLISRTFKSSKILTPKFLAPFASAWVIFTGSACPSFGSHKPPRTSSVFKCGYLDLISALSIFSISTS